MAAIRSYYEGRKFGRQLRKLRADERQRRQLAELMTQAMDIGFEDPTHLSEIGRALFEKGIGRDVDWPKGPGKWDALAQAHEVGPEETRKIVEAGQASPDLLEILGAEKQFAKQVFGEEPGLTGEKREYYRIGKKIKEKGWESLTKEEGDLYSGIERQLAKRGTEEEGGPGSLLVAATKEMLITEPRVEKKEVRRWATKFNEVWNLEVPGEPWNRPPFISSEAEYGESPFAIWGKVKTKGVGSLSSFEKKTYEAYKKNEDNRKRHYKHQVWEQFRGDVPADIRYLTGQAAGVYGEKERVPGAPQKPRVDRGATKSMKSTIDQWIKQGSTKKEIMDAIDVDEERLIRDGVDVDALLRHLESKAGDSEEYEPGTKEEILEALLKGG